MGRRPGGQYITCSKWRVASTSHIAAMAAFYKNRIGCRDVTSNNKSTLSTHIATMMKTEEYIADHKKYYSMNEILLSY